MRVNFKENKGITLIALVVTIIVLLILAGISISMLTGQNGILNRASEAKEKTATAQKEENETLNDYEKIMDKYTSNLSSTKETMPYLPDAMKFEKVSETDLTSGLVIREKATGSEYVWVEVPKTATVYPTAGINITNAEYYKQHHPELTEEQVIDWYKQRNGQVGRWTSDGETLYSLCKRYEVNYQSAITYRKHNSSLSNEQIILHYRPDLRLNVLGEIIQ